MNSNIHGFTLRPGCRLFRIRLHYSIHMYWDFIIPLFTSNTFTIIYNPPHTNGSRVPLFLYAAAPTEHTTHLSRKITDQLPGIRGNWAHRAAGLSRSHKVRSSSAVISPIFSARVQSGLKEGDANSRRCRDLSIARGYDAWERVIRNTDASRQRCGIAPLPAPAAKHRFAPTPPPPPSSIPALAISLEPLEARKHRGVALRSPFGICL